MTNYPLFSRHRSAQCSTALWQQTLVQVKAREGSFSFTPFVFFLFFFFLFPPGDSNLWPRCPRPSSPSWLKRMCRNNSRNVPMSRLGPFFFFLHFFLSFIGVSSWQISGCSAVQLREEKNTVKTSQVQERNRGKLKVAQFVAKYFVSVGRRWDTWEYREGEKRSAGRKKKKSLKSPKGF